MWSFRFQESTKNELGLGKILGILRNEIKSFTSFESSYHFIINLVQYSNAILFICLFT